MVEISYTVPKSGLATRNVESVLAVRPFGLAPKREASIYHVSGRGVTSEGPLEVRCCKRGRVNWDRAVAK